MTSRKNLARLVTNQHLGTGGLPEGMHFSVPIAIGSSREILLTPVDF